MNILICITRCFVRQKIPMCAETYSNIILDEINGMTYGQNELNNDFYHHPARQSSYDISFTENFHTLTILVRQPPLFMSCGRSQDIDLLAELLFCGPIFFFGERTVFADLLQIRFTDFLCLLLFSGLQISTHLVEV